MKPRRPTSRTWRPDAPVDRLELVLLGDTAFGENYEEKREAGGRVNKLTKYGYDNGFEQVDPLLREADLAVANLKAPLTTLRSSPFADARPYPLLGSRGTGPSPVPQHRGGHAGQ